MLADDDEQPGAEESVGLADRRLGVWVWRATCVETTRATPVWLHDLAVPDVDGDGSRKLLVNHAAKDLPMTKEFSSKLGFANDPSGRPWAPMPTVPRAVACVLLITLGAHAEAQEVREPAVMAERSELAPPMFQGTVGPLGARLRWTPSSEVTAWMRAAAPRGKPVSHAQGARVPATRRGTGRIILGAVVGAVGGLFAGGYVGAAIEGDGCHCDDQGLMGALIGAPIGAALGGIAGGKWLF